MSLTTTKLAYPRYFSTIKGKHIHSGIPYFTFRVKGFLYNFKDINAHKVKLYIQSLTNKWQCRCLTKLPLFNRSVISDSLQPQDLQHTSPPFPSLSPELSYESLNFQCSVSAGSISCSDISLGRIHSLFIFLSSTSYFIPKTKEYCYRLVMFLDCSSKKQIFQRD